MKEWRVCSCYSDTIKDIHINSSMESDMFSPFSDALIISLAFGFQFLAQGGLSELPLEILLRQFAGSHQFASEHTRMVE